MTITRWDPFSLKSFAHFPYFREDWDEGIQWPQSKGLRVRETKKSIIVKAVVAGVPAKDIEVGIEDGVLTIKAEAEEKEEKKRVKSFSTYHYYYTTALAGGNWPKAKAEIEDGLVTITIPKAEEAKPQKIEVTTKVK
ncbi:Hsp20/alpha crystallin family protein [Patescibacteria group bacterium]